MRILSFFCLFLLISCTKEATDPETDKDTVNLTITATTTPATANAEGNIVSRVRCSGPNLCYRFKEFEVKETGDKQYDIRAKGTFPTDKNTICAQAVYVVDTTVSIKPAATGRYTLRFYNGTTIFKTDIVQVN